MMDFICFILLAIAAFGVGLWAGRDMDSSFELSDWSKERD